MRDRSWTLDQGLDLVRRLEALVRPHGLFTGLSGSVLYKGESKKDLDIIVMPLDASKPFPWEAFEASMVQLGMRLLLDEPGIKRIWAEIGSTDTKHVEAWTTPDRKRVDIFILPSPAPRVARPV